LAAVFDASFQPISRRISKPVGPSYRQLGFLLCVTYAECLHFADARCEMSRSLEVEGSSTTTASASCVTALSGGDDFINNLTSSDV